VTLNAPAGRGGPRPRGAARGSILFWTLIVTGGLFVALTLRELPPTVATNFGSAGVPHAWMSRRAYTGYVTALGLLLPLLAVALVARHRAARAGRWWLGSLLAGLALGVHLVILDAHRTQPPRLSTAGFLALLGLFAIGLVSWVVRWRRGG